MIKICYDNNFLLSNLKKIQRKFLKKIVDGWIYGGPNMDTNVKGYGRESVKTPNTPFF